MASRGIYTLLDMHQDVCRAMCLSRASESARLARFTPRNQPQRGRAVACSCPRTNHNVTTCSCPGSQQQVLSVRRDAVVGCGEEQGSSPVPLAVYGELLDAWLGSEHPYRGRGTGTPPSISRPRLTSALVTAGRLTASALPLFRPRPVTLRVCFGGPLPEGVPRPVRQHWRDDG